MPPSEIKPIAVTLPLTGSDIPLEVTWQPDFAADPATELAPLHSSLWPLEQNGTGPSFSLADSYDAIAADAPRWLSTLPDVSPPTLWSDPLVRYDAPIPTLLTTLHDPDRPMILHRGYGKELPYDPEYIEFVADRMAQHCARYLDEAVQLCAEIFPASEVGVIFRGRAKPYSSYAFRLLDAVERGYSIEEAKATVTDGIGISMDLHTAGERGVQKFVDALCKAVREKKISVIKISDHRGTDHVGYLTPGAWQQIQEACQEAQGHRCLLEPPSGSERANGFTTLQVNVLFPGGIIGDIQVRGSMVDWVVRAESVVYALKKGYDPQVDMDTPESSEFRSKFENLTTDQRYRYDAYTYQWYNYARLTELGQEVPLPQLPEGFSSPLFDLRKMLAYKLTHKRKPIGIQAAARKHAEEAGPSSDHPVVQELAREFRERQERVVRAIAEMIPVETVGEITFHRAKKERSIAEKLLDYCNGTIPDLETARLHVRDGNGVTIMLHTASSYGAQKLVDALIEAVKEGKIIIKNLSNKHGQGIMPYLSEDQIGQILDATREYQNEPADHESQDVAIMKSGFTAFALDATLPDGTPIEIQAKGSMMEWIWKAEHTAYKLYKGKCVDVEETDDLAAFREALQNLDEAHVKAYKRYVRDYYAYARQTEMGYDDEVPEVPEGLEHPLFDLLKLHQYTLLHGHSRR